MKHIIKIKDMKPFQIWNENGKVMQSGWIHLPAVLEDFGNTKHGNFECGAYIAGMATLSKIIDGRYINVKPETAK